MQTILITGASGFIGHHLMKYLSALDYKVFGTSKIAGPGLLACDIAHIDQVMAVFDTVRPDIIIHAAGLSSVTKSQAMDYYLVNVVGTENIIAAIDALGGRKRIIFLSSATVYGNQDVTVLQESLCPKPVNHYGCSKFIAEQLMRARMEAHDVTILRLFNIIGTGQEESFIVPKLVQHFKSQASQIELGNIASERDYLPVAALTGMIGELLPNPDAFNEILNVCQGEGTSVEILLQIMTELTRHDIEVVVSEKFLRQNEVMRLVGDVTKLERILGHSIPHNATAITLQEMLTG